MHRHHQLHLMFQGKESSLKVPYLRSRQTMTQLEPDKTQHYKHYNMMGFVSHFVIIYREFVVQYSCMQIKHFRRKIPSDNTPHPPLKISPPKKPFRQGLLSEFYGIQYLLHSQDENCTTQVNYPQ